MPVEDHANLHTDRERILEAITQAKLLYAVTPKVPEYRKIILIIRPRTPLRGYSLWVKESYEEYRRSHF
ncbi:MAG: hypothetical protein QXO47_08255 [Thermoproteota archaeon]